jgi:hypothetical protein
MTTEKPGFHVIYGIDNVMNTQLELISNARRRLDICVENTQPH